MRYLFNFAMFFFVAGLVFVEVGAHYYDYKFEN